jgi:hypothetical protein
MSRIRTLKIQLEKEPCIMANTTESRPLPRSGAESEFDRGTGASPYKASNQGSKSDNQNIWILVIIGLAVLGGGLYYYINSSAPSVVTPEITQTTPPAATTEPDVVIPPTTTTEPAVPPVMTPDPSTAPKTTP